MKIESSVKHKGSTAEAAYTKALDIKSDDRAAVKSVG